MSRAPGVATVQGRLQANILRGAPEIESLVVGDATADARTRLGIYVDAYRLRLLEVLRNDFPVLLARLGLEEFERLGRGYIEAQGSDTPSVRWFGRHFAAHLRAVRPRRTELAELAAFEWAQGEVFDAPDAAAVTLGEMARVPATAWAQMRVLPHPSLRTLELRSNAPALAAAHAAGSPLPRAKTAAAPGTWALWRRNLEIRWRTLADDEAAALEAVRAHASFGEVCERLCEWIEPDAVALHAAGLLKRWIGDEWVAEIELH